jgi:hypothetical protein
VLTIGTLADMQEFGGLFWTLYGVMSPGKRRRKLRALRIQCELDVTDELAEVIALRRRLRLIDNGLRDYMLGGKQEDHQ